MKKMSFISLLCGFVLAENSYSSSDNLKDSDYKEIYCNMRNVYFGSIPRDEVIDYEFCYKRIVTLKMAEKLNNYRLIFNNTSLFFQIDDAMIDIWKSFSKTIKNDPDYAYRVENLVALDGFINDMSLLKGNKLHLYFDTACVELQTNQEMVSYIKEFGVSNLDVDLRSGKNDWQEEFR